VQRGVNCQIIVVADASPERFRTALILASAQAALGRSVRLFLQGEAVRLARQPIHDPDAARQTGAGLPTLGELIEQAFALGIIVEACQSTLALLELDITQFDSRIAWGGMVSLLAESTPEDRIIVV